MDSTAIELIQRTTLEAAGANRLNTHTPSIVLTSPNGQYIQSLENYEATRSRFRGTLATTSLDDFAIFVKETVGKGDAASKADGFVDVDSMSAKVIFNLWTHDGEPGHADWDTHLKLKPTAAYAALLRADGTRFAQKELADWLEDWNQFLFAEYTEGDGNLARAVAAIRKLTINASSSSTSAVTNVSASRSAFEDIEAKTGNDLPLGFSFVSEPYLGLASRTFRLVLSVLTGDAKPTIVLRWQQREATVEAIAEEFKKVLGESLGDASTLTIGTFKA